MVMSMNTHQFAEPIPPSVLLRAIRFPAVFALLSVILMLLFMASLLWGAVEMAPAQAWAGLMRSKDAALETALIWQLRLPRALLGMLLGLQLATAGLILQAVMRNPLADPGIVGISSGSALAVVVALLWEDGIQADSLLGENHADMTGEEAWLVGEWRSNGERKYYLSNLPANATLKALAAAIKARWVCEQAHQQMKEELGLDHFEGRSWQGLHRHALMTMIAYAFLQHQRLQTAKREKKETTSSPWTA